jgi:hypothetical protein
MPPDLATAPVEPQQIDLSPQEFSAEEDAGFREESEAKKPVAPAPEKASVAPPPAQPADDSDGKPAPEPGKAGGSAVEKAEAVAKQREQKSVQGDGGFDVKAVIQSAAEQFDKLGIKFTNPDPDGQPVSFADVAKEYPTLVEMAAAFGHLMANQAVAPISQSIATQEQERAYQAMVGALEGPEADGKHGFSQGDVDKLLAHPDFDAFFSKDRPTLSALVNSNDAADVAMALRAFAEAKGIPVGERTPEERAAVEAAEQRRKNGIALHSGTTRSRPAPRGSVPARSAEEEEDAGWLEGQEADSAKK